jgi:hypothetical protein
MFPFLKFEHAIFILLKFTFLFDFKKSDAILEMKRKNAFDEKKQK